METGRNKRLSMHSKCPVAGPLAGLGSLSGGMTQTSISEGSEPLVALLWSGCGCCGFQFIITAGHGSTKSGAK